ncbi:MAG: hypothetical protein L0H83_09065 [Salinisphaera sp.]|nr:hypothetical protein [Salinisphaera sp.]
MFLRAATSLIVSVLMLAACADGPSVLSQAAREAGYGRLVEIANGKHRSPENIALNKYRHPAQTLHFFGVKPNMTVVEVWPEDGWYTEMLAPYIQAPGQLYVAGYSLQSVTVPQAHIQAERQYVAKLRAHPQLYGQVKLTAMGPPLDWWVAPPGSADVVLTFRDVWTWIEGGYPRVVFEALYKALKPGGILGVVAYRAKPGTFITDIIKTGYVTKNIVLQNAAAAGFQYVGSSEINANPKDSKDYPAGVWTLPPILRLGDKNRQRYLEIGAPDRMTLKFRRPVQQ